MPNQQQVHSNLSLIGAEPNSPQHFVTMKWVEDFVAGRVKAPVRALSANNLAGSYSASGLTLTLGATGALVIDGIAMNVSDRVLLVGQTDETQNGIYDVTVSGDGSTAAELTRSNDFNESAHLVSGVRVTVNEGTLYADTAWKLATTGTIILDSTALEFIQVAALTGAQKFAKTITGDNLTTDFAVQHDLGTTDIDVTVWNLATNSKIIVNAFTTDNNTVVIAFGYTPTTAQSFRVVVVG